MEVCRRAISSEGGELMDGKIERYLPTLRAAINAIEEGDVKRGKEAALLMLDVVEEQLRALNLKMDLLLKQTEGLRDMMVKKK